jgi:prepilin-type N-terminal cleavage/methylation domain-containing protein
VRRRESGFTLIEISAVILILALFVTMATAYLDQALPQARLESAARSLASEIANLRFTAVAQSRTFSLEYDLDGEAYRIVTPFRADGRLAQIEEERIALEWSTLPDGVDLEDVLVAGERFTQGIYRIDFTALGHAVEHFVHLRRTVPEGRFTLAVSGLTGRVQFLDGYHERPEVTEHDFPR